MALTSSTISIILSLTARDFTAAGATARAELARIRAEVDSSSQVFDKVGTGLANFSRGLVGIAALSGVIQLVAGVTAALQQLLPAALLAPGAILVLGAAFATFKIATAGFADALGGDADALAKLAPSARATVDAIHALAPEFDAVRKATQQSFFAGFAGEVRDLGGMFLPILQRQLPLVANGFNEMGRSLAFALKQERVGESISNVLDNTTTLLHNARNALGAFASGFIQLGSLGSNYLPKVGIAIDGVAQKFQRFVENGLKDGSLKAFIDRALAGFKDLGAIIGNVASVIGSIFTGLAGPSGDVLASLRATTDALAAFFKEAGTQTALTALGDAMRTVADAVRNVLLAALEAIAPIVAELAPVVAQIADNFGNLLVTAIQIVGPLLLGLAGFLNDNKEVVGLVADALLILYGRFLLFKGIEVATVALGRVVTALGGLSTLLKVGGFVALGAIAVDLDKINVAAANGDPKKLDYFEGQLHNIVGAGKQLASGDIGGIISDIGDEVDQAGEQFRNGTSPIGAFFKTVSERASEFVSTTGDSIGQIGQFFSDLPGKVGSALSDFGTTVKGKVDEVGKFFSDLPGKAGDALASLGSTLVGAGKQALDDLGQSVSTGLDNVGKFFEDFPHKAGFAIGSLVGTLIKVAEDSATGFLDSASKGFDNTVQFFRDLPGKIGEGLSTLATTVSDKAVEAGASFLESVTTGFNNAVAFFTDLPTKIGDGLSSLGSTVSGKAEEAGTDFLSTIQGKFAEVVAFVSTLPQQIGDAISDLANVLGSKASEAGASLLDGITNGFNQVVQFAAGLGSSISNAVGDLGSLLVNAGRSVIDGLLQGIKDAYNSMISFVSGIADGIAANKGPLPYDRIVLKPAGLALMGGLLNGIKAGYGDVQAFAASITGDLVDTLDTSSIIADATAATTAAGDGRLNRRRPDRTTDLLQQLLAAQQAGANVRVFIGDKELKDMVKTEIGTSNRATSRTVRATAGIGA